MANRCPSCEKFVGLEMADPEAEDPAFSADENGANITCEVRIHRDCDQCGEEMKEATLEFDVQAQWTAPGHAEHDLSCEVEVTPNEKGGGRYAKSYFGVDATFRINCDTCSDPKSTVTVAEITADEFVAASEMDEMN